MVHDCVIRDESVHKVGGDSSVRRHGDPSLREQIEWGRGTGELQICRMDATKSVIQKTCRVPVSVGGASGGGGCGIHSHAAP